MPTNKLPLLGGNPGAQPMSETSETIDRIVIDDEKGEALMFDGECLAESYYDYDGQSKGRIYPDIAAKLNAALTQPVPSGVLTEELIQRLTFLRVRGIGRGEVFCDECGKYWPESEPTQHADNCILSRARSAQQGETVTVRREVLADWSDRLREATDHEKPVSTARILSVAIEIHDATKPAEAALAATKGE